MNRIKIIFFDIDGTLVDMQTKRISAKTTEVLRRLKENGIKICIATGRSPISLPKFDGVDFDAYLTFNGSYCYDQSGAILSNPIRTEDVQTIIRNAAAIGRPVAVATKDRLAANGTDDDLAEYYSFAHQVLTVAEDFEAVCQEEIYQIMLGCRESDYPAILKGVSDARIAAWWDRAVDIIPANGGKGMGIKKILDYYHLDRTEAMAFGDGNNDIEMLEAVGTGIAMENASNRLKTVASDVCGHVAEDGIYHYCIKQGLI
ncbi:MAG: Cof-type HAD-IIB family hydrolase [Oscillospiraceae bacterium]|nr:Cof-type HAD-IIB family hydrolase [Oscillospiraceae bacterium]